VIHIEFATPVDASQNRAWQLLREKAETPERFIPHIRSSEVVERGDDELLRHITFNDDTTITERITFFPEHELVYHFVDHPKFEGEIRNLLFQADESLWLSIYFQGKTRAGVELGSKDIDQLRDGFIQTVLAISGQMEEIERATLETT